MTTEHSTEEPETGPAWLARLTRASQLINLAGVSVAAVLVTMMTGLILLEISLRVFSLSTQITDVWVAYAVAAVTFLSAPWVLEQNSMLKVAIVVQALPRKPRLVAEFFGVTLTLGASIFLIFYQYQTVVKLIQRGTTSADYIPVPLWLPGIVFLVGLCMLSLQLLVRLLRLLVHRESSEDVLSL